MRILSLLFGKGLPPDRGSAEVQAHQERQDRSEPAVNAINVSHPYKSQGTWMFDDPAVGLRREPFVSGADAIIDRLVQGTPSAESGFTLLFSAEPFPGYQVTFEHRREEMGGNWYYCRALNMEGWLCPALLKYFHAAPKTIYAQFRAET